MAEHYSLRGKYLLDKEELREMEQISHGRISINSPVWREGEILSNNNWFYTLMLPDEVSEYDLALLQNKGLKLLVTEDQASRLAERLGTTKESRYFNCFMEVIPLNHNELSQPK